MRRFKLSGVTYACVAVLAENTDNYIPFYENLTIFSIFLHIIYGVFPKMNITPSVYLPKKASLHFINKGTTEYKGHFVIWV